MIAKKVNKKTQKASSFKDLADYITRRNSKDGQPPLKERITNCLAGDDYFLALKEINATQAMNTRAKSDKTYHLVISFPRDEYPTDDQMIDIEDVFCERLGYADHQRISAVHTDTENVHIHVVINKIHPDTFNIHEPYYDRYRLNEISAELEAKHGLTQENHTNKRTMQPALGGTASLIEHHNGLESFQSWVQTHAYPSVEVVLSDSKSTWADLQYELGKFDLEARLHGAGLVISHRQKKLFVKASSIARELSKGKLEKRFGSFEAAIPLQEKPKKSYSVGPIHVSGSEAGSDSRQEASVLYTQYQKERNSDILFKKNERERIKAEQREALDKVRIEFNGKRAEVKNMKGFTPQMKKKHYQRLAQERMEALALVTLKAKEERKKLSELKVKNWNDFLISRSNDGDESALRLLRRRSSRLPTSNENALQSAVDHNDQDHTVYQNIKHQVTKDGVVAYDFLKAGKIQDSGPSIYIKSNSDQTLIAALQIAKNKYGSYLKVTGSWTFQANIARLAAEHHPDVRFDRVELEETRRSVAFQVRKNEAMSALNEFESKENFLHRRFFDSKDCGEAIYRGCRKLADGSPVGFFEKNDELLIVIVPDKQDIQFNTLKCGQRCMLGAGGFVRAVKNDKFVDF